MDCFEPYCIHGDDPSHCGPCDGCFFLITEPDVDDTEDNDE